MKKGIFLATLIGFALATMQMAAFADHDRKHYPDHNRHWNYDQFCAWHNKHHHGCDERELHARYDRYDRDREGFWREEFPH